MTDADMALSILRKMAALPDDWHVERLANGDGYCRIEANYFDTTPEEADLLERLRAASETSRGDA